MRREGRVVDQNQLSISNLQNDYFQFGKSTKK